MANYLQSSVNAIPVSIIDPVSGLPTGVTINSGSATLPVAVQGTALVNVQNSVAANFPALPAGTDRSGSITTANTAQVLAAANTSRFGLTGQNVSTGDLWITENGTTAVVGAAGSYKIVSGAFFSIGTNRAVSIIGATAGQAFTATEV